MEVIIKTIDVVKIILTVIGSGYAIVGGQQFFAGQGQNNGADKEAGLSKLFAGGGMILIAQTVVPLLIGMMQ